MAVTINGTTGVAVPLGTAAAPGVVNTTSATTGIYNPTSTTLGLSTNGTNAVYIDASQNVGIGTSSPGQRLDLGGGSLTLYNSTGTQQVYLYRASSTNYSSIGTDSSAGGITFTTGTSSPTERMRIDSSGIITGTAGNLMLVNLARVTLSSTATPLSTAIPSWAKKITLAINGLSSSGTADYQVQIGSGSYTSSGYTSFSNVVASTGGATTSTSGFVIRNNEGAAQTSYGHMTLTLQNSATNTWISSHSMGGNNATKYFCIAGGGVVSLAGVLDRIQITAGGTDTLDAGTINIQYE